MRKIIVMVFAMMFAGTGFANAYSDWSFELTSSDNLSWELYFNSGEKGVSTNGGSLLNFYFMDFQYDADEIAYVTYTPNHALSAWLTPIGSIRNDSEAGTITNVGGQGLRFSDGYHASSDEVVLLGKFTFTEVSSVADGIADLLLWLDSGYFGVKVDEIVYSTNPGYADLAITVNQEGHTRIASVPVPAAVWLLGSGLMGLVGLRRRNR